MTEKEKTPVAWGDAEIALLLRLEKEAPRNAAGMIISWQDILEKGGSGFHHTRTAVRFSRQCLSCSF